MKTVELDVPDISCGHCVSTVESALAAVEGVRAVVVSLPTKRATVHTDDALPEPALLEAVREAGYTPSVV
ncbi:MAG: heavy-metal-associated domain-containing protein [Planctomycetota bacterium]|jgi:copper chaperone CopZ